tara:strand:+ start:1580 stop:2614 length:1035 start_codon:yes stop_codon:yes gene_type:complete
VRKKIIIIGNMHPSSIENMFYNSFKKLEVDIKILDPNKHLNKLIHNKFFIKIFKNIYFYYYNRVILKYLNFNNNEKNTNDIVFFFKGESLNKSFLFKIKNTLKNYTIINFNTDNPFYNNSNLNKKIKGCIKYFDYYFTWSKEIRNKIIKNKFQKKNKVIYLPFAFDSKNKKKFNLNTLQVKDKILFYGSWDKDREKMINQLNNDKIEIYGNAWQKASSEFKKRYKIFFKDIFGIILAKKIREYGACLNINRPQVGNSHNMRLFEVTGYGGLLISPQTKETNFFFKNNKEIITYKDQSSLKDILKINFKNRNLINIRKNSLKVSKNHSYVIRSIRILTVLKNDKI